MNVTNDTSLLQQSQQQKVKVVAGYALQQRLGSGSFATVYKAARVPTAPTTDAVDTSSSAAQESSAATPDVVAIKAITRTSEKLTKKVLQNLEIEISILRTYRHPNIVCMHNVQKTDRHFYLILEYCGGGDVQRLIRTRKIGRLTERLARRLMRDLGAGLQFLWGQELIHRDIKPQNLLLTGPLPLDELNDPESTPEAEAKRRQANFPSEQFSLKIADFGFARHLQTASLAETLCGSPLYMAPEILQHHRYDAKADLWSVGTVLFEMIAGRPPFNGENHIELLRNIQRKAVRLPPDVRVSKACVNLLRLLLNRNPLSRAGFKEFFEACDAFCALGCEGVPIQDCGTCRVGADKDLGTIHEHDSAAATASPSTPPSGSDSLMTVATNAQQHIQKQQQAGTPHGAISIVAATPHRGVSPPFNPLSTPTSLGKSEVQKYPNRLAPLEHSPPAAPVSESQVPISRVPVLPSLSSNQPKQPWQQTHNHPVDLHQSMRKDMSQSQASTDESGFVMVEYGTNNSRLDSHSTALQAATPSNVLVSTTGDKQTYNFRTDGREAARPTSQLPSLGPYYTSTTTGVPPLVTTRGDYMVVNDRRIPPKGMLSTSPGTGGLLMGLVSRAAPRLSGAAGNSNQLDALIGAANQMITAAEDVGRRAVSVAHLGDSRAYLAMRLVFMNDEGSSLLSAAPMEGVEEEPRELSNHDELTDDSSSTEIMAPARRRSSHSTDRVMMDAKIAENQAEEMPFAISPDAPAVALPSRNSLSVYGGKGNQSSTPHPARATNRASPSAIRGHFGEALSCYLKALKMLRGAVGAAQRVTKDIESVATQPGGSSTQYDIPGIQKRCEVTSNWLCGQFRGVLERADAANVEISKLPSSQNLSEGKETIAVCSVEELIYNHSLASGRDGAVKQLLGQYEAARTCYRSAGLLAETLLMEATIGAEDRKILEGYVDGFAARITELDDLMLQQSRMVGSSNTASSRRGSGVIGLISPPPSAPGMLVGSPR